MTCICRDTFEWSGPFPTLHRPVDLKRTPFVSARDPTPKMLEEGKKSRALCAVIQVTKMLEGAKICLIFQAGSKLFRTEFYMYKQKEW